MRIQIKELSRQTLNKKDGSGCFDVLKIVSSDGKKFSAFGNPWNQDWRPGVDVDVNIKSEDYQGRDGNWYKRNKITGLAGQQSFNNFQRPQEPHEPQGQSQGASSNGSEMVKILRQIYSALDEIKQHLIKTEQPQTSKLQRLKPTLQEII